MMGGRAILTNLAKSKLPILRANLWVSIRLRGKFVRETFIAILYL